MRREYTNKRRNLVKSMYVPPPAVTAATLNNSTVCYFLQLCHLQFSPNSAICNSPPTRPSSIFHIYTLSQFSKKPPHVSSPSSRHYNHLPHFFYIFQRVQLQYQFILLVMHQQLHLQSHYQFHSQKLLAMPSSALLSQTCSMCLLKSIHHCNVLLPTLMVFSSSSSFFV